MNFRRGQRVICIASGFKPVVPTLGDFDAIQPEVGGVYTIRYITNGDPAGLMFYEIRNKSYCAIGYEESEPSFIHTAFRPVCTRKTDISIFQKMLTPADANSHS